jgi:hypothetical protein
MLTPHWTPLTRSLLSLGAAVLIAAGSASAQTHLSATSPVPLSADSLFNSYAAPAPGESSSSPSAFVAGEGSALPSAPAPNGGAAAAGQAGGSGHGLMHHLTFEAGGGFNAPSSSDQQNYITWGGQFTLGAGYRFNDHVSALVEYQFMDDKLPGRLIAETGANGGYAHIWSFGIEPVVDLLPKSTNDVYVTGGGGFYRKVTNFTDPEETEYCDYYYCEPGVVNQVVGHFSSNQGGWNIGGGFTHRLGGIYGDGRMKLFAEVRYLDVLTPAVNHLEPNGLSATSVAADTKLIPVTFGVRF